MAGVGSVVMAVEPEEFAAAVAARIATTLARVVQAETLPLVNRMERMMAKIDDLVAAAQNVSDQAAEHRAVVDEAIALIQSIGVEDPRLDDVLAQLNQTAQDLDQATTDLAAADDVTEPVEPGEEPVEPGEEPPPDEPV